MAGHLSSSLDYHINIGWYDIDLDFLKIVDKPLPKVEKPKAEKKPAAKAPAGEAASAAGAKPKPAAKPAAGKNRSPTLLASVAWFHYVLLPAARCCRRTTKASSSA